MIPNFTMNVTGVDRVISWLQGYSDRLDEALEAAMLEAAYAIMDESVELVPIDLGQLKASAWVNSPTWSASMVSVAMGYGGPAGRGNFRGTNSEDVGYAVIQHERLDFHHPHGQAKFLEQPAAAFIPRMTGFIAERMQVHLNAHP